MFLYSLWRLPKFTILLSFVIKDGIKGVDIQTTSGNLHRESSVFGFESNLRIVTVNYMHSVVLCELWIHNYSETTFVLKSTKIFCNWEVYFVSLYLILPIGIKDFCSVSTSLFSRYCDILKIQFSVKIKGLFGWFNIAFIFVCTDFN